MTDDEFNRRLSWLLIIAFAAIMAGGAVMLVGGIIWPQKAFAIAIAVFAVWGGMLLGDISYWWLRALRVLLAEPAQTGDADQRKEAGK